MDTIQTTSASTKTVYSSPASPSINVPETTTASSDSPTSPAYISTSSGSLRSHNHNSQSELRDMAASVTSNGSSNERIAGAPRILVSTPKKDMLNAVILQNIREKLLSPGSGFEVQALAIEHSEVDPSLALKLVKERYLISAQPSHLSAAAAAKTPASYRHLIDLTSSNLKCLDVYTGEMFQCKIINEPLHKVQRAYFQLQQDGDLLKSRIYGHELIRNVHDIVPLCSNRTYIIIAPIPPTKDRCGVTMGVFENLHTYIRNQKRICETEARTIFHQICQTVQVCHRNGIILRDLKLKRFYFIDKARTKLQYESLEGSMILDNQSDDTLSDKIGCPLYTAPELLCPHPTYRGKPADMWSLGVILYTMLVGQYPFYEKANCNLITIIRHCNVQIPSSLSHPVRWILHSLLRKNHTERVTASVIFLMPWLKEQRPFHLYLPVNVEVVDMEQTDDDDYDDDEINTNDLNSTKLNYETQTMPIFREQDYDDSIGVQPLDYTQTMGEHNNAAASTPTQNGVTVSVLSDIEMNEDDGDNDVDVG